MRFLFGFTCRRRIMLACCVMFCYVLDDRRYRGKPLQFSAVQFFNFKTSSICLILASGMNTA